MLLKSFSVIAIAFERGREKFYPVVSAIAYNASGTGFFRAKSNTARQEEFFNSVQRLSAMTS